MSQVRLAIVYYSTYGTNHRMAEIAAEAARAAGAEVRLRKVREAAYPHLPRSIRSARGGGVQETAFRR